MQMGERSQVPRNRGRMSKSTNNESADDGKISYIGLYPEDWITGCRFLSPLAEWAYLQICLEIWDKGKAIPDRRLRMLLSRAGGEIEAILDELKSEGKIEVDRQGRTFNRRAIAAHRLSADKRAQRVAAARKMHEKRAKSAKNLQKTSKKSARNSQAKSITRDAAHHAHHGARHDANENENENETPLKGESPQSPPPRQDDFLSPISEPAWEAFKAHRRGMKKPLSGQAAAGARRKLERIHAEHGHDPAKVIEQSIENGWVGLFPLKDDFSSKRSGWGWVYEE